MVPKRAPDSPLTRLTLGFESDGQFYGALDAARRFGADEAFGVRVNLVGREGDTSVSNEDRSLRVASIGTDFRSERLRLSVDIGYQDHHLDDPRPQVTPIGPAPAAPDASGNFAQPWTFSDERQLFGVARGEFDFSERGTLWLAFGGRYGEEENRLANPNATTNGATTAFRFDNTREDEVLSADGGVRFEFQTGAIGHRLTVSASAVSLDSHNAFAFSNFFSGVASDLRNPLPSVAPSADFFLGGDLADPLRTEAVRNWSVAMADMMSLFDGRVLATVGLRRQTIRTRSFDFTSGNLQSEFDDHAITPVGGLVLRPYEWLSLYANYSESLQPGEIAPATSGGVPISNAGEVLAPFRGDQVEFGLKLDRDSWGGSIAAFTLARPNSIVDNGVFTNDGEQRTRGVEISFFGEPMDGLRIIGGVTFLDAELETTQSGVDEGNTPVGVPDVQANVNLEWDVPGVPGLTLDGRVIHTDRQYINSANTLSIPSWTRIDLGARYRLSLADREVVLRGRVENLGDRDFWASAGGFPGANYLVLGMPRTFVLSASVDF